jgi:hypothetical protein
LLAEVAFALAQGRFATTPGGPSGRLVRTARPLEVQPKPNSSGNGRERDDERCNSEPPLPRPPFRLGN